jgi:hypothetical protein
MILCISKRRVYLTAGWSLQNARKLPGIPARSGQPASLNSPAFLMVAVPFPSFLNRFDSD